MKEQANVAHESPERTRKPGVLVSGLGACGLRAGDVRLPPCLLVVFCLGAGVAANERAVAAPATTVGVHEMVERTFTSARAWQNGFMQVDVDVTFTHAGDPATELTLPAFWNGQNSAGHDRFTVRFAPTRAGDWTYQTRSSTDKSLDGLEGPDGRPEVIRAAPSSNHGFIQRSDTFHWEYTSGQRFFPVGTTAYEWIGGQCAEGPPRDHAIEFVRTHFNKVRLSYMTARLADNAFGGTRKLSAKTENGFRWYSDLSEVDSRVINLAHWEKLDRLIGRLHDAGIHVELILARKSPAGLQVQGNWLRGIGGRLGAEGLVGDKGIRYFVARYAAFPRLWWCIGNEWPEAGLTPDDIRRIGAKIQQLDPYDHPLSAHWNEHWMFGGEAWPTHGILQTHLSNAGLGGLNQNVIDLRTRHGVAFVNAEYGYEARVRTPNTPENVVKAHWAIVLGGGYADYGHSPSRLAGKYMWAGLDHYWAADGRPAAPPASVTEVAAGQEAAPALRIMRDWMNSGRIGTWRMQPDNALVAGGATNRFCLAAPGAEYLVSAEAGTVTIDLSAAAGRDLAVEELDPFTGEVRACESTRGAATYERSFPAGQFRLLHIGAPPTGKTKVADGDDPDIAIGSDDTLHVAYVRSGNVYYRRGSLDGNWGAEISLGPGADPCVAVTADGVAHVAATSGYNGGDRLFHCRLAEDASPRLRAIVEGGRLRKPRIATDAAGNAVISFEDRSGPAQRVRCITVAPTGAIGPVVVVGEDGNGGVAVGRDGARHFVWRQNSVKHTTLTNAGRTGPTVEITPRASDFSDLALDPRDQSLHVVGVVANARGIYYVRRTASGRWLPAQAFDFPEALAVDDPDVVNPAIAIDGAGRRYVTFSGANPVRQAHGRLVDNRSGLELVERLRPYAFIIDERGAAGDVFQIDPTGGQTGGKYRNPQVASTGRGGASVVWEMGGSVWLARLGNAP